MNMDKYFMWIHYERLHNHNKIKAQQNRVHISWDMLYNEAFSTVDPLFIAPLCKKKTFSIRHDEKGVERSMELVRDTHITHTDS